MQPIYRSIILAGLAATTLTATAQDLSKKFSFTSGAASAPTVLEALTKASGVLFTGGTQVKDDVLAVRFKDVTVREAMEKIAQTMHADWQESNGGFLLTRISTTKLQMQRDEGAVRATKLDAALKKMLGEVEKTPKLTEEDAQRMAAENRQQLENLSRDTREGGSGQTGLVVGARALTGLNRKSPGARAIVRILSKMKVLDLAAIRPNTRVVYSFQPTQMQRPLPPNCSAFVTQFVEEQRLVGGNPGGGAVPLNLAPGGGAASVVVEGGGGGQPQTQPSGRPGKALLIINRMAVADGLQCELRVADAQTGQFFASGSLFFAPEETEAKGAAGEREAPIKLSQNTKDMAKMLGSAASGVVGAATQFLSLGTGDVVFTASPTAASSKPIDLTAEWRERILNPERFEPLSTAPGEFVLGLAEQRDLNMVASLPDSALIPTLQRASKGEPTPSEVLSSAPSWNLNIRQSDGWLLVEPSLPASAMAERVDRKALGTMLRVLDKHGRLTLDDLAAYAITTESAYSLGGLDYSYLRLLDPVAADRQFMQSFGGNREMLQFYGYMSGSERQALMAGRSLTAGGFSQKCRELLHSMVYNSIDGPQLIPQGPGGPGGPGGARFMGRGNLASERTEALSTGVPSATILTLRGNREPAVLATDSEGANGQILTADGVARMRNIAANLQGQATPFTTQFENYVLGEQTEMTFRFDLSRTATLTRRLHDDRIDRKAKPVSWDQLPQAFRQAVQQMSNRMERNGRRQGVPLPPGGGG